jgi:hypothetical protein
VNQNFEIYSLNDEVAEVDDIASEIVLVEIEHLDEVLDDDSLVLVHIQLFDDYEVNDEIDDCENQKKLTDTEVEDDEYDEMLDID